MSPARKLSDSIQTDAAEEGLGAGALLRTWGDCQDKVCHLHKEQRSGQRHLDEARENHDWDEGHAD